MRVQRSLPGDLRSSDRNESGGLYRTNYSCESTSWARRSRQTVLEADFAKSTRPSQLPMALSGALRVVWSAVDRKPALGGAVVLRQFDHEGDDGVAKGGVLDADESSIETQSLITQR